MNIKSYSVSTCLSFSLFLILAGCADKPDTVVTIPMIKGPWNEINIPKLLENSTLYPLTTTTDCLVGERFFFLDGAEDFYILDKMAETVYRFRSNGDYLNKIGEKGKGPDEYVRLYEGILTRDNRVELLAGFPETQVYTYSADGELIARKELLEYPSWSFIYSPGLDQYYFYGSYFQHKIIGANRSTGALTDSMLTQTEGAAAFSLLTFSLSGENAVLFCEPIINKIYEITSSGISEKYRLDYGKYSVEQDLTVEEMDQHIRNTGLWATMKVLENKNFVYLYSARDLPDSTTVYQHFLFRKADRSLWTLTDQAGFSGAIGPAFHLSAKDELYLYIKPADAAESKKWSDFFYSKGLGLNPGDNPVVLKLKINEVI